MPAQAGRMLPAQGKVLVFRAVYWVGVRCAATGMLHKSTESFFAAEQAFIHGKVKPPVWLQVENSLLPHFISVNSVSATVLVL